MFRAFSISRKGRSGREGSSRLPFLSAFSAFPTSYYGVRTWCDDLGSPLPFGAHRVFHKTIVPTNRTNNTNLVSLDIRR